MQCGPHEFIERGDSSRFCGASTLFGHQDLALAAAIQKLDKCHLLILDDLTYLSKTRAEISVLFELVAARYERRGLMITANQLFGDWDKVFPDKAMAIAAIDRLVHHSVIFEMNVVSYHRRAATNRAKAAREPDVPVAPVVTQDA